MRAPASDGGNQRPAPCSRILSLSDRDCYGVIISSGLIRRSRQSTPRSPITARSLVEMPDAPYPPNAPQRAAGDLSFTPLPNHLIVGARPRPRNVAPAPTDLQPITYANAIVLTYPISAAYARSFFCRMRRPRNSRDFTVPSGTPSAAAIYAYSMPCTSISITADWYSSGRARMAATISSSMNES